MIAHDVMLDASGFLNDAAQSSFTDAVLLPYMKTAWNELREILEENNIEVTNALSAALVITAGIVDIGGATGPALPQDLIEIQTLWERTNGTSNDYTRMEKKNYLPKTTVLTTALMYWVYQGQVIKFLGATSDTQVRIDYIGKGLPDIESANSLVSMINCRTALAYRVGGLAARFVGENPTRADELDNMAQNAMERSLNINIKSQQSIATRRRPFRLAFKSRGW